MLAWVRINFARVLDRQNIVHYIHLRPFRWHLFTGITRMRLSGIPSPLFLVQFFRILFRRFFDLLLVRLLLNRVGPRAAREVVKVILVGHRRVVLHWLIAATMVWYSPTVRIHMIMD